MGTGGRVGLGAWGREDGGTEVGKGTFYSEGVGEIIPMPFI